MNNKFRLLSIELPPNCKRARDSAPNGVEQKLLYKVCQIVASFTELTGLFFLEKLARI